MQDYAGHGKKFESHEVVGNFDFQPVSDML